MGVPRAHHWTGACCRTASVWRFEDVAVAVLAERGVAEAPIGMAGVKPAVREGVEGVEGMLGAVSVMC